MVALCLGWAFFAIMPTVALGYAWAALATGADAVPRRSPVFAWSVVAVLTVMPLLTLWTLWPIRLLFLAARPQMEQIATDAIARRQSGPSRSVGLFHFAETKVDPSTGDVALLIEPDSSHPRGFLWKRSGAWTSARGLRHVWLEHERLSCRRLVVSRR